MSRAMNSYSMNTLEPTTVLSLKDICLSVQDGSRKRQLLNHVNLQLNAGEVVGLVGPSGSGKSTLLTIAGCLQEADSGTATLYAAPPSDASAEGSVTDTEHGMGQRTEIQLSARGSAAAKLRRNHIGIVFQQPNLLPALTVRQQLLAMRRISSIFGWSHGGRREAEERADELLAAVGLAEMVDRKIAQLSGGQQARVNIARALMNSPEVLLVDEPTAALDQKSARMVTALIMKMTHDLGIATLYITHDRGQLNGADHVVEMVDGQLQAAEVETVVL